MIICLLAVFGFSGFAVGAENAETEVAEKFAEAAENVADASGSSVANELVSESIDGTGSMLMELLSPKEVLQRIFGSVIDALPSAVSLTCVLTGLVTLSAVSNSISGAIGEGGVTKGFEFLSCSAVIAAILGTVSGQMTHVSDFFDNLSALMESMIPITGTVWAMGGNVTSAGAGTATLYAMLAATGWLCSSAVLPVCCVMGVAAVCSCLSDGGVLDGFCAGVKRVYNFLVGLLMTVFVFTLGAQTTVAGAADTAVARGAKLLSATVIPGVGGAVGDTLRTVAGSVGYIKSVVGVGGIVLVLILTLPTLISLLLSRLSFLLCSTLADALGCKREGKLLLEMGNIYGLLVGAVAICSVAFIIAFGIFVRCAVALE